MSTLSYVHTGRPTGFVGDPHPALEPPLGDIQVDRDAADVTWCYAGHADHGATVNAAADVTWCYAGYTDAVSDAGCAVSDADIGTDGADVITVGRTEFDNDATNEDGVTWTTF